MCRIRFHESIKELDDRVHVLEHLDNRERLRPERDRTDQEADTDKNGDCCASNHIVARFLSHLEVRALFPMNKKDGCEYRKEDRKEEKEEATGR